MVLRILWLIGFSALTLFLGCSSDSNQPNFSYLRSPAYFKADTAKTDTELCTNFSGSFASEDECKQAKKYRLSWLRPEDTTKFRGYRIYVDTLYPNSPKGEKWSRVQTDSKKASIIVERTPLADEIIFVFSKGGSTTGLIQDTLKQNTKKIFVIDSTLRQNAQTGQLVFALVPVYDGDVTPGQPQLSWFIVNDKFQPDIFSLDLKVKSREIDISWARPTDPTSFFDITSDTGLIRNYWLEFRLGGQPTKARKAAFGPKVKFFLGDKDISSSVKDSLIRDGKDSLPIAHLYFLPDSNRAVKTRLTLKDSLKVKIDNLIPQDTLELMLWAEDSSGNNNSNAMQRFVVHLTDTTQPLMPKLSVDSTQITANGFILNWTSSSDTLPQVPNYGISEYRLTRSLVRDSGEKISALDKFDTTIIVNEKSPENFVDTIKFLPPGRKFHLRLSAVDRTGFESEIDTLNVTTKPVRFKDNDTGLVCPNGFVPIPRGNFILGDGPINPAGDELPSRTIKMDPFCIEPYEHRDAAGNFMANVSWQQADSVCRSMAMDPGYQPMLCSEVEWERACEGPGSNKDSALAHGILSEQKNAGILQGSCNQGTNDSVMARSFDLRNATCLTGEGVYDMAGNYSEWVRDPYYAKAYSSVPAGDSLSHAFSFTDTSASANKASFVAGFRGGNFLKPPNLPTSTIQSLARCSNRDYAQQVRPIFRPECRDQDRVKIAIIYGPGIDGHFCMDIPDSLKRSGEIINISPRDSTLEIAFSGETTFKKIPIKYPTGDTLLRRKKPISSQLTTRSLAVIEFIKPGTDSIIPDTLDTKEMKDTSQAVLAKIFAREEGKSGWSVKKVDGKYAIRYLYAYSYLGTKPAKPNYSSRAIGFRCCSLPQRP